eukprot:1858443-Pleurochrysis_carterae.AAC.5
MLPKTFKRKAVSRRCRDELASHKVRRNARYRDIEESVFASRQALVCNEYVVTADKSMPLSAK